MRQRSLMVMSESVSDHRSAPGSDCDPDMSRGNANQCAAQVVRGQGRQAKIGRCALKVTFGDDLCGLHRAMANRGYYVIRWKERTCQTS